MKRTPIYDQSASCVSFSLYCRGASRRPQRKQYGAIEAYPRDIDRAIESLVKDGKGLLPERSLTSDELLVDNRKPKGPKRLDPKSTEARTLPLPFYGGGK